MLGYSSILQYIMLGYSSILQYIMLGYSSILQYIMLGYSIYYNTSCWDIPYTTIHHVGIFQYTTVLQYSSSLYTTLLCSIIPSTRSCRSCGALAFSSILHSPASTEVVGNEEIGEGRWRNSRITIMADAGLQWLTYISTMAASTCVVI